MKPEYDENGNLVQRIKMDKKLKESFLSGRAIRLCRTQLSRRTPMLCHIEIESKNNIMLNNAKKIFLKLLSREYSLEDISQTHIAFTIPGHRLRCTFCEKFRQALGKDIAPVLLESNCESFKGASSRF